MMRHFAKMCPLLARHVSEIFCFPTDGWKEIGSGHS